MDSAINGTAYYPMVNIKASMCEGKNIAPMWLRPKTKLVGWLN